MSRSSGWRSALAVMALCLTTSSWVASTTQADAQTAEEELTPQAIVDLAGVDLIGQTAATPSSPAVIHLRVADELSTTDLRARLYAPVTTRAELLASLYGPPPTSMITEWIVEDARIVASDDAGVVLSVPIQPPDEGLAGPMILNDGRPLPLHLEVVDADGAVVGALTTFLTPGADAAAGNAEPALMVAPVLDLRLPPSHVADGGAATDGASLSRVLGLAEVLIERPGVPLSVVMSPETLDALALIGDDTSLAVLRTALRDRQLLATTWTSLDIYELTKAVRVDMVLDGLRRSAEALRWAGLEASTVMHFEYPLTVRAVRAITEPAAGVSAFVTDALPVDSGPFPPVTLLTDSSVGSYPLVQADPILAAMLQFPDPELGMQWAHAELLRIAAAGAPKAVVVAVPAHVEPPLGWQEFSTSRDAPLEPEDGTTVPVRVFPVTSIEPTTLAMLLDTITGHPALRPATVDDVLAQEPPVGSVAIAVAGRRSDPGDYGLYLARLVQVEQRLEAYESFLGNDPALAAPLRTLLAVSASEHLTTGERREFLNAVDQQATQGTTGVEFMGRGPITFTERNADLPVTLVNNRDAPATVVLELSSDRISLTHEERPVFTLEPGRNDLIVPVEAAASGRTSVRVTVTTPDPAGAITITTGTFSVRFTDAEGLGLLILVWAAAALGAWWLQTLRRRSRDAVSASGTVAATGSGRGNAAG